MWGCLDPDGKGEDTDVDSVLLAEGPVGGARRAAGPRGGERVDVDKGSNGPDLGVPRADADPERTVRLGDCSRDSNGERALMEPGRGEGLSDGGCDVMADEIPESRAGEALLYD